MRSKVVIFLEMASYEWLGAASSILESQLMQGNEVQIVDLSGLVWPYLGGAKFENDYEGPVVRVTRKPRSDYLKSDLDAIQSIEISILRGERSSLLRSLIRMRLLRSAGQIRSALEAQALKPDILIVPNGRFPVAKICLNMYPDAEVFYFEVALPGEELYWLKPYPIHDRVSRQIEFSECNVDHDQVLSVAEAWLKPRMTSNSKSNPFAKNWIDGVSYTTSKNVFFTSSTDEYWALGEQWHEDSWVDQYEAFDHLIFKLEEEGEGEFLLRLHPNMLNKSLSFIREELTRVKWLRSRHPSLKVVYPHESINSYQLLTKASRVFVSMSTIGLEASMMGKSVWCTSATSYDLVADVKRVLSPQMLEKATLEPWNVDPFMAKKFVYLDRHGYRKWEPKVRLNVRSIGKLQILINSGILFTALRLRHLLFRFAISLLVRFEAK
jgi:hypothetical protein